MSANAERILFQQQEEERQRHNRVIRADLNIIKIDKIAIDAFVPETDPYRFARQY